MRYKAIVSYDGTNYAGWQVQKDKPTIQACLNKAISQITNEEIKVTGSGRTDGQVHAKGQVFHFDTEKTFKDLAQSINSQLPKDIFIRSVEPVDNTFHSRFDAQYKHYDYRINNGEYDPLLKNYTAFVAQPLNLAKMRKAAKVFIGQHDFTSFNATSLQENENQVREIYKIEIIKKGDIITIAYFGTGFLRYMVRMLSQGIIDAGLDKVSADELKTILEAKSKTAGHFNGQPQGLYLMEVGYQPFQKH